MVKHMIEDWLTFLDKHYLSLKKFRNNKNFFCYPDLTISLYSQNISLIFRKNESKTQYLFNDSYGRLLYLSDIDIIKILKNSSTNIFGIIKTLFEQVLSNYSIEENEIQLISFRVASKECYYLDFFSHYISEQQIQTLTNENFINAADMEINYMDLLLIINLILSKEYIFDIKYNSSKLVLRQLRKYYYLMNYYKDNSFREELLKQKYDVENKIEIVYTGKVKPREIDKVFDNIETLGILKV